MFFQDGVLVWPPPTPSAVLSFMTLSNVFLTALNAPDTNLSVKPCSLSKYKLNPDIKSYIEDEGYCSPFLGGLSLHLNHLIVSHAVNYNWPFGTLPFGLFGSNLDTRDLETYPRTYSGHFGNMSLFRWFKFTLKPPYSIAHDKLRLAIWDTSFWTFWLKFGHKGPWDIC